MWANRITLDYIKHQQAREKLEEIGFGTDENPIIELTIKADSGYVIYEVEVRGAKIIVSDDGNLIG